MRNVSRIMRLYIQYSYPHEAMQDQANCEARTAARAVSSNQRGMTKAALYRDISEREKKCRDALHQQRFIRQTATM